MVAPHLSYGDGPVVTNARVYSVLWGATAASYLPEVAGTVSPNMDTFFGHISNSAYVSWLNGEYNTSVSGGTSQSIGYGMFAGRKLITPAPAATGATIDGSKLEAELFNQINTGQLPAPTYDAAGHVNTVYAVFVPAGSQVCLPASWGGGCSGTDFCAYHFAMPIAFNDGHHEGWPYMVLPDEQSSTMINGCGSPSANTPFPITQSTAAHELVESMTDPDGSIAAPFLLHPTAWLDANNGEIADICWASLVDPNGTETGTDGNSYVVQQEWSNAQGKCIVDKGSTTPSAPRTPAANGQSGATITLSWSAPASDGGTALTGYDVYQSSTAGSQGSKVATVGGLSWTSPALTPGSRYYFQVVAHNVNGDGAASGQVSAVAETALPQVTITAPAALFQLTSTVTSRYSATGGDSGVASYDVQYRVAGWVGGFGAYANLATATTATSTSVSGTPGHEYCFHVRARDHDGNVTPWSPDKCAVLPVDDRTLGLQTSGWARNTNTLAYQGTISKTTTHGAALRLRGTYADRIALVVTTCPTCGTVGIYLNGTLWHTVFTGATTTHYKVILLPGMYSLRTATILLEDLSTVAGRQVLIDGLGLAVN